MKREKAWGMGQGAWYPISRKSPILKKKIEKMQELND